MPWFFSILWAGVGLAAVGYGDIGAWCWFVSDPLRLFVNFIPRWLIIITILALYTRLFIIIHKTHNHFMPFDDAAGSLQTSSSATQNTPRLPFNFSDYERRGQIETTHTRIGRTSSTLKRVHTSLCTIWKVLT